MPPCHRLELVEFTRPQLQPVDDNPRTEHVDVALRCGTHAEPAGRIALGHVGAEPQRPHAEAPETHVDQPRLVELHPQGEMVQRRAEPAFPARHPASE